MMYKSIEDLRDQFELSESVKKWRIRFNEYALLFRLREGAKSDRIFERFLFLQSHILSLSKKHHSKI